MDGVSPSVFRRPPSLSVACFFLSAQNCSLRVRVCCPCVRFSSLATYVAAIERGYGCPRCHHGFERTVCLCACARTHSDDIYPAVLCFSTRTGKFSAAAVCSPHTIPSCSQASADGWPRTTTVCMNSLSGARCSGDALSLVRLPRGRKRLSISLPLSPPGRQAAFVPSHLENIRHGGNPKRRLESSIREAGFRSVCTSYVCMCCAPVSEELLTPPLPPACKFTADMMYLFVAWILRVDLRTWNVADFREAALLDEEDPHQADR